MAQCIYGVPCKIGYGYNDRLKHVYKFEGANPQNVKSTEFKRVVVGPVRDLSGNGQIQYGLGQFLADQVLKSMEFQIVNDDGQYYWCYLTVLTKKETCSNCGKLPENTEYYVTGVYYGTHVNIMIPKQGFSAAQMSINYSVYGRPPTSQVTPMVQRLLESAFENVNSLSEKQKKTKCRVLINAVEEGEMALEDVCRFNNDCLKGQHPEYQVVVAADVERNTHNPFVVRNSANFQGFLAKVYAAYRKIEMKLETTCHIQVVPVPERAPTYGLIISNLASAKKEYSKLDLKKDDTFKIYQGLKALFWNYRYYLEYVIDKRLNIEEGNSLPPGWQEGADFTDVLEEFLTLLKRLNHWTPVKIGSQWYCSHVKFLFVSDDFDELETKMKQLFPEIVVKKDNQLTEPRLLIYQEIDGFFGFVDMSRPSPNNANVKKMA